MAEAYSLYNAMFINTSNSYSDNGQETARRTRSSINRASIRRNERNTEATGTTERTQESIEEQRARRRSTQDSGRTRVAIRQRQESILCCQWCKTNTRERKAISSISLYLSPLFFFFQKHIQYIMMIEFSLIGIDVFMLQNMNDIMLIIKDMVG